jgi:hypothetical protein
MNDKLINELLTMQVVDFIAASQDRHNGNFFINPEAMNSDDPGDQVITGIDNDLAFNTRGEADENNNEGLGTNIKIAKEGKQYRAAKQVDLQFGFSVATPAVKNMVDSISIGQVESTLRPYLGREDLARAVMRYKHLKAHFAGLSGEQIVDLKTQEGRDAFRKSIRGTILKSVMDTLKLSELKGETKEGDNSDIVGAGFASRNDVGTGGYVGDLLYSALYNSKAGGKFVGYWDGFNMAGIYQMLASLGMTREEAMEVMTSYNKTLPDSGKADQSVLDAHFKNKHFLENLPGAKKE